MRASDTAVLGDRLPAGAIGLGETVSEAMGMVLEASAATTGVASTAAASVARSRIGHADKRVLNGREHTAEFSARLAPSRGRRRLPGTNATWEGLARRCSDGD